jgi:hypothetical protein
MRFKGGKSRKARQIAKQIARLAPTRKVIEPFMGAASVTCRLVECGFEVEASDVDAGLVSMWKGWISGEWSPPGEREHTGKAYCDASRLDPSDPDYAFFGYGCSYTGQLWRGWAGPEQAARSLRDGQRRALTLSRAKVTICRRDFFSIAPTPNSVLFCDPPDDMLDGPFHRQLNLWVRMGCQCFVYSPYHHPDAEPLEMARLWVLR